jgi:hypothetical protein
MVSSVPGVIGRSWRMAQCRRRVAAAVIAAVLAVAAGGCGDDGAATVAEQATSAPAAATATAAVPTTTTPATATPTATTPATTGTAPTATTGVPPGGDGAGEDQPGGAGDEEPIRVPAAFRVQGATITPRQITVPAFLPVALAVTAVGDRRRVTVDAPGAGTLDVAAGGTARRMLDGLKPGDYPIVAEGGGRATLHVTPGGDAGP